MKSLKEDFSLMSSLLIPVAVAINFTGFGLVKLGLARSRATRLRCERLLASIIHCTNFYFWKRHAA